MSYEGPKVPDGEFYEHDLGGGWIRRVFVDEHFNDIGYVDVPPPWYKHPRERFMLRRLLGLKAQPRARRDITSPTEN